MNKKYIIFIIITTMLVGCCEPPMYEMQHEVFDLYAQSIFPKGNKISGNITGTGWLKILANNDSTLNTSVSNITFESKSRTYWHKSPGEQILLVTWGNGYYQERGKPVQLIKKGDIVRISPDVEHWYGATAYSGLTQISISTNLQKGTIEWLQSIPDNEYNTIKAGKPNNP